MIIAVKIYLGIIGAMYVYLGGLCAFKMEEVAEKVGFKLIPGTGQSEFLTVYGGLEIAMGIFFLWPVLSKGHMQSALLFAVILHFWLVLCRSIAFMKYSGIGSFTYQLAIGEWVILIAGSVLYYLMRR